MVAGVDVGGTKVLAGAVDARGRISEQVEIGTEPSGGTSSVLEALRILFERHSGVAAIGVAAAAFVEQPSGRIVFAPNLHYDDPDIGSRVSEEFGLPVVVENDANAAAWGEYLFGAGRGSGDLVMLTIGTGIGGGIIAGGKLFHGSRGFAGEVGHITLDEGGPQCACGRKGCFEALASGSAIERMAREGGRKEPITGEAVTQAAAGGDQMAMEIFHRAGYWLGVGLASITYMFDPGAIVIGGGVAASGQLLLGPAVEQLNRELEGRREVPPVIEATLGNEAGIIGAAALARESIPARKALKK